MSRLLAVAAVIVLLGRFALAKDEPSTYPEGASEQTYADHQFELVVPKAADPKPPWSLVLVFDGDYKVAGEYGMLASQGYVVCSPKPKSKDGMFATSETEEILDLRDHLAKSLPIAKDRLHVITISETHGISSFVVFSKRSEAVSYTLVKSTPAGKSPSPEAKKRLGILFLAKPSPSYGDPAKAIPMLSEKVRTVEYRPEDGPSSPYFAYWLGVMDGRYEPGRDLSFEWIVDPAPQGPATPKPDPGPPAAPAPVPAETAAKEATRAKRVGALVYFWSADDAEKPDGRNLQNSVFFDAEVRAAGKSLVAVKLERAKHGDLFAHLGLASTPAVAVVDADFNVLERFEGAVKAPALAKALAKAAGASKPK